MGNKCSCLCDTTTEEKVLTTERKLVSLLKSPKLDIQELEELENSESIKECPASPNPVIVEVEYLDFNIIWLQSVLRGFLERRKTRKSLQINSFQTFRKDSKKTFTLTRRQSFDSGPFKKDVKELTSPAIPNFSSKTVLKLHSKLSPFLFKSCRDRDCTTRGPVLIDSKAIYTGSWNNLGQRHGLGTQTWYDGSLYEGEWKYDACNGQGRVIKSSGDYYEGSWLDDQFHGFGKYQAKNGNFYEGFWQFNQRAGKGFEFVKNVSMYTGDFLDDEKSGQGSAKYENGDSFEGQHREGKMHGFGVFKWKDGRVYKGEWKDGVIHGQGELKWKDGRSYVGEFESGKKHGTGKFVWNDGRVYEGQWRKDKQEGEGVYITSVGVRKGVWRDGKRVHD